MCTHCSFRGECRLDRSDKTVSQVISRNREQVWTKNTLLFHGQLCWSGKGVQYVYSSYRSHACSASIILTSYLWILLWHVQTLKVAKLRLVRSTYSHNAYIIMLKFPGILGIPRRSSTVLGDIRPFTITSSNPPANTYIHRRASSDNSGDDWLRFYRLIVCL